MTMKIQSVSRNLSRSVGFAVALSLATLAGHAQQPQDSSPDPALANMAPGDAAQQNTGQPATPGVYPQQAPAPIVRSAPNPGAPMPADTAPAQGDDSYNAPPAGDAADNPQADAQVAAGEQALDDANVSSDQPPPALPDYDQPEAPGDNYMWTPGYWGYGPVGYYWVPGVWIVPPYYGGLWTPGYWGWWGSRYRWHPGYWGLHIGFYGGVNYGFGYIGTGYFGGYWHGNAFIYNRAVTHVGVNVAVTNVYNRTVVYGGHTYGPQPASRVSYNGGHGGIQVAPRPGEFAAMHEAHTAPLPGQVRLRQNAAGNPQAAFSANHGHVSGAVAVRQQPLGANRPIANNAREFQSRPQAQPRPQNQPRAAQQPHPQSRPAPASHPQSHPSAPHNDKH
jgi:hypothetical protein